MSNILKFKKPANDQKPKNSLATKIMIATIILLAIIKLPELIENSPAIYREHSVKVFSSPIKLPDNYMVLDINGGEHKLAEMLGDNITIFAFWATWCGYCKKEFPHMDSAVPEIAKHGVKILPIARGDETSAQIQEFFEHGNLRNMETIVATTADLHRTLGVNGYPSYIAVDRNGMAFAKLRPNWEAENLSELFDKLGGKGELK